jgi:dTDP-4-dehydrorhamnose reductase
VDLLFDGIQAGRSVRAFSDRTVSPSFVEDVVLTTSAVIDQRAPYGLYHCVNSGYATWVDVAREIARLSDRPGAPIEAVPMADAGLKAPRPKFAAMSNGKLAAAGITLPSWQDALERYGRVRTGATAR